MSKHSDIIDMNEVNGIYVPEEKPVIKKEKIHTQNNKVIINNHYHVKKQAQHQQQLMQGHMEEALEFIDGINIGLHLLNNLYRRIG